jgi:hypothetical protein
MVTSGVQGPVTYPPVIPNGLGLEHTCQAIDIGKPDIWETI